MGALAADPDSRTTTRHTSPPGGRLRAATRPAKPIRRLLRGRRFVDLYAVVRHALRAASRATDQEPEPFYRFTRDVIRCRRRSPACRQRRSRCDPSRDT